MQQQQYDDLEVPPGTQVNLFRYREKKHPHHLVQHTVLTLPNGSKYEVKDSAEGQLWGHCDESLRMLRKVYDWRQRNKLAQDALDKRIADTERHSLILRVIKGTSLVGGVVTELYTEVTHTEVFETFEMALGDLHLNAQVKWETQTTRKLLRCYKLDQEIGEGMDKHDLGLVVSNSETGMASVGVHFYAWRQVCSNGMMAYVSIHSNRLRHIGDKEELMLEVKSMIEQALEQAHAMLPAWQKAKATRVTFREAEMVLSKRLHYPNHLSQTIATRLLKYEGLSVYGLINAMTWVASHHPDCAKSYKLKLQQDAHRMLMMHSEQPDDFARMLEEAILA